MPDTSATDSPTGSAWIDARLSIERHQVGHHALRILPARAAADPDRATQRPPILWIHGLGESGRCFEALIARPELARWTHLVPDLVGYGRSPWVRRDAGTASPHAASPRGLDGHTEDVLELLGTLREGRWLDGPVILAGHSMGGVIGTTLLESLRRAEERGATGARRDAIAGFANIEGNITLDDCTSSAYAADQSLDDWLATGFEQHLDHLDGLRRPVDAPADDARDHRAVLRGYSASIQLADPRAFWRDSCELVEVSTPETLAHRLAAAIGPLEATSKERTKGPSDSKIPTVYLYGRTRGTGERSLRRLRDADIPLHGFEPAGHWPYLDQPAAFAAQLATRFAHWGLA